MANENNRTWFNAEKLFGWAFARPEEQKKVEPLSFSPREGDDGAAVITASGAFGVFVDLDGSIRSEVELINRYRAMEQISAVDIACDEIADEVIVNNNNDTVKIILDNIEEQPDRIKKAIESSFRDILDLLDFRNNGFQIFKRWYIDGRLYFHVIIDEDNTKDGIQELRYVDPRKIRKIREVVKRQVKVAQPNNQSDAVVTQTRNEYYVYSDKGFNVGQQRPLQVSYPVTGLKIAKDAVLHATSGLVDAAGTMTLSYLHKAIKPLNMYSTLKDQSMIYRLVRSPGRRVWYVDVGSMPTIKANQYVKQVMNQHRNKMNYDAATGEVREDKRFATMLEDFWLPINSEGKGTKVENLDGQANFNQIDDILFFQKELYQSLHVPVNRISQDDQYSTPVATEITRDEIRFGKFIARLRKRFATQLFVAALEKQLVLKQVMSIEDFKKIKYKLDFQFCKDNYFEEAKANQVETMRVQLLTQMAPFVGRYYSNEWIRKHVLRQNDEDILEIDNQIAEEESNPQYEGMPGQPPMEQGQEGDQEGQEEGEGSGVIVSQGGMEDIPEKTPNNGTESKSEKAKPKPTAKKGPPNFKKVSELLNKKP